MKLTLQYKQAYDTVLKHSKHFFKNEKMKGIKKQGERASLLKGW
jgi:hypothetical protein